MKKFRRRGVKRPNEWIALAVLLLLIGLVNRWEAGERELPQNGELQGRPRLVDGDSFHLGAIEVRLQGIDAPEGRQTCKRNGKDWACGETSRRELARLIGGRSIVCDALRMDQHGRALAICKAGDVVLNSAMVASGYAVAFGSRYTREERDARGARRGLWAGEFERPQDWRRARGIGGGK